MFSVIVARCIADWMYIAVTVFYGWYRFELLFHLSYYVESRERNGRVSSKDPLVLKL